MPQSVIADQPLRRVTREGTEFVLLGTAHVSKVSADAVREILATETFDAVAVELCPHRADAVRNPEAIRDMDLFRVMKEGRAGAVAVGLALGAYQRRLATQFGIEPGAEMKTAMEGASARGLPCWLVDRDVGVTLRRTRAAIGWWERTKLSTGLVASLIDDSSIEESEIEKLKEGDILESAFTEFARRSPPLFEALISERDRYMAARLREEATPNKPRRVLVVVGAGHLEGLARHLAEETRPPAEVIAPVVKEPPPSNVGKYITIAILVGVLAGFAWAFFKGGHALGLNAVLGWIGITGVTGAIGAIVAGGHPLSILSAFVASPLTPLHPALSSGMVSGAVELWARKPRVGDFQALRDDLSHIGGWWRNRVSRVFLVFFLTNLGTMIGVWTAGVWIAVKLSH